MPVELARNATTKIWFVGEDDVVSEQIPPPAASASLTKIAAECTQSSSDERIDPNGEIPEGYRLFFPWIVSTEEFAERSHSNSQCAGEIIILLSRFTQYALISSSLPLTYLSISLFFCCRPSRISQKKVHDDLALAVAFMPFVMIVVCQNSWLLVNRRPESQEGKKRNRNCDS